MTAVMVTGATTPLGTRFVERLLEELPEHHILAIGYESPEAVRLPENDRVHYERVDLTRRRAVKRLLFGAATELGVETIVHAPLHRNAGDVGRKVHAVNVETTRCLLLEAERLPSVRRFVFRSHLDIYRVRADQPSVFGEEHPINFSPRAPQWLRDRVEADVTVCARMGMCDLQIAVLRCSECVGPDIGSQLYDYVQSAVCLRPLGYDPMLNVLSIADLVEALVAAVKSDAQGVFNIPGMDTLPLSALISRAHRISIPLPGPLLRPLYRLRSLTTGTDFRYDLNLWRFHFSGVPDGRRARDVLGYTPQHAVQWSGVAAS